MRPLIFIMQVECKFGSLNQGDTFVLDDGRNIYVWVGPTSEKKERLGVSCLHTQSTNIE